MDYLLRVGFVHPMTITGPEVVFSETFTIHTVFAIESRGAICTGSRSQKMLFFSKMAPKLPKMAPIDGQRAIRFVVVVPIEDRQALC